MRVVRSILSFVTPPPPPPTKTIYIYTLFFGAVIKVEERFHNPIDRLPFKNLIEIKQVIPQNLWKLTKNINFL